MKPWKRHTNRFEPTSAKHRFNGATAMKPWKRGRWFAGCSIGRKLQWGHGDEAVEESWESNMANELQTRFNGATAMKPWKSFRLLATVSTPQLLQWGHGDEAVEEDDDRVLEIDVAAASM